jgi:plastocyanin
MYSVKTAKLIAAVAILVAIACGGSKSPTAPDTGSTGPSGATITIANGAISPKTVTIALGQSVTFVNNDTRSHEMASDPHPSHTQCPAINALGTLSPGQTRLTNALSTAMTCGFHDHNDDSNTSLQGSITIR